MFAPSYTVTIVGMCLMGFMMLKNSIVYSWTFEFLLKDHKPPAATMLNSLDYSCCIFGGVYFLVIGISASTLLWFFFALSLIGYFLVSIIVPESPKWLLLQGRREEAIKVLNYIAWINRSKTKIAPNTQFVECAVAEFIENQNNQNQNQSQNNNEHSVFHDISRLSIRATQLDQSRMSGLSAPRQKSFAKTLI